MSTIEKKFSFLFQKNQIADYYWEHGYVVINKALPDSLVDAFIHEYETIKKNKDFIFFSQTTHRAVKPTLSSHGYIIETMLNATMLGYHPEFCESFKQCIFNNNVSKILTLLTGHKKHIMWQNMFFDRSVGTIEHQDHWHLDTLPGGNLIGVWYALEDIHADSGPFFIVPGSHKKDTIEKKDASNAHEFMAKMDEVMIKNNYEFHSCLLKKGDILFWHPMLIHGSHSIVDEQYSRKSLTAHFYPKGLRVSLGDDTPSLRETDNANLLRHHRISETEYSKQLKELYESYNGEEGPINYDMRRDSYKDT